MRTIARSGEQEATRLQKLFERETTSKLDLGSHHANKPLLPLVIAPTILRQDDCSITIGKPVS